MKKVEAVSAKQAETLPSSSRRDYLEVRLPKISFRNTPINIYLVAALVIFSFLLGMLTNKVVYLEQLAKNPVPANTAVAGAAATPEAYPTAPPFEKVENGHLPQLGENNAKVTIVEFSDFQCPFCDQYVTQTHQQIIDTYIKTGKAKFFYRHFPLSSIHPNAEIAAEAAECANEQDKFWDYHDLLFKNQATWSPLTGDGVKTVLFDLADQAGVANSDQFKQCLNDGKYKDKVAEDTAAGTTAQVDGTPAFFINGNRLTGAQPFSEFQKMIDAELKK